MREVKFSNGLDTRLSNDPSKNADLIEDIKNPGQQKLYLMSNNLVSFSERLVDIFDGYYPEKKNEELAAAQAETREQAEKTLQYYNVIRDYEKKFTDNFVQVKSTDNALYQKASEKFQKMMVRFHREKLNILEADGYKADMKATRKALEEYIWDVRDKYGYKNEKEFNNIRNERHNLATASKIINPAERKKFEGAVAVMEDIYKCEREIDNTAGKGVRPKSLEDWGIAAEDSLRFMGRGKDNNGKFRGNRSKNSKEFNHMMDVYDQVVDHLNKGGSVEERREQLAVLREAAAHYMRAKLQQKGYDTKDPMNRENNLKITGDKPGGAHFFSQSGKDRYNFAKELVMSVDILDVTLSEYEKQLEINRYEEGLKAEEAKRTSRNPEINIEENQYEIPELAREDEMTL